MRGKEIPRVEMLSSMLKTNLTIKENIVVRPHHVNATKALMTK